MAATPPAILVIFCEFRKSFLGVQRRPRHTCKAWPTMRRTCCPLSTLQSFQEAGGPVPDLPHPIPRHQPCLPPPGLSHWMSGGLEADQDTGGALQEVGGGRMYLCCWPATVGYCV